MTPDTQLLLGTALWGWTTPDTVCFQLLDRFYALGGRVVDTATNYPINRQPDDFRRAERILAQWLKTNGIADMEVMMKIGSINNMRTPDHNLSPSFLLLCADEYGQLFGTNLRTLMVHWDNRADAAAIAETLDVLRDFKATGLDVGLSGIQHPDVYAQLWPQYGLGTVPIQIKHNLLHSDWPRYAPLHAHGRFIAYGINAGGLKLPHETYAPNASLLARGGGADAHLPLVTALAAAQSTWANDTQRPTPDRMNHLGMLYAALHPAVGGIILGVSQTEQLDDAFQWLHTLGQYDYAGVYAALCQIAADYTAG